MVFFLHANAKVASRYRHAANIAFDLFNIILYVIARKVRKCPLSPVVTSNIVLSGLARLADILARLVQMADSLSALQLTGALFTINWGTLCQTHLPPIHPYPYPQPPPPPPPTPTFWTAPPPLTCKEHLTSHAIAVHYFKSWGKGLKQINNSHSQNDNLK